MYTYTVPINNPIFADDDREKIADLLSSMGVRRVMLTIGSYLFDEDEKKRSLDTLKDNCEFLKEHGFEVGVWLWTFMDTRENSEFTRMRFVSGAVSEQSVCPSDAKFRKFAADYLCDLARCGVDIVLYDDDFRYGNMRSQIACLCENHLEYMRGELGEEIDLGMLEDQLFCGGANKYRSAWIKSKKYYFELFAKEMRQTLDKVAPSVRLGVCSSYTSWEHDAVNIFELSKLLAGNTKPFVRLCGAPYWAVKGMLGGHKLQDTIELSRMQIAFAADQGEIEVIGEGDTYPRPRLVCPASYLEGFDQALRANGGLDGLLKYTMDYCSTYRYEMGYNKRHIANLPLYDRIDEIFGDKTAFGVRVYEYPAKYENTDIPSYISHNQRNIQYSTFSYASRMLSAATVPTTYDGTDTVGIVFGENAKYLPKEALKNGLIIDARAAEILTERGIDVGIETKGERVEVFGENFLHTKERVALFSSKAYMMTLKENAEVQSTFTYSQGMNEMVCMWTGEASEKESDIVGSYFYENANGERFLVFSFDGTLADDSLLRNYERADQLKRGIPRLGKTCGFYAPDSPNLYCLAKRKENKVALGLWNFCADSVEEPFISAEKTVRVLSTIGCEAEAREEKIILSRIEPYGFAAVEFEEL